GPSTRRRRRRFAIDRSPDPADLDLLVRPKRGSDRLESERLYPRRVPLVHVPGRDDDHGAVHAHDARVPGELALQRPGGVRRKPHDRRHDRCARDVPALLVDERPAVRRKQRHVHRGIYHARGAAAVIRFFRSEDAQGLIEFALILPPLLLILVFGLVEIGTLLSVAMTMSSATREGARVASAIVNGGGALGCSAGQSPNAATVDPNVVAAVERVLVGDGSRITLADLSQIRIAKATATGAETAGLINTWNYQANGGPVIDGQQLDFVPA